jgi:hypothetical protein
VLLFDGRFFASQRNKIDAFLFLGGEALQTLRFMNDPGRKCKDFIRGVRHWCIELNRQHCTDTATEYNCGCQVTIFPRLFGYNLIII